jgi:hypothetical protein
MGLVNQDKFDTINRLIPLPVIPLSGAYCIIIKEKYEQSFLKTTFESYLEV